MTTLLNDLKQYRADKGLSQEAMARLIGISFRTYHEIEKTGEVKKADVLHRISQLIANHEGGTEPPGPRIQVYDIGSRAGIVTIYQDEKNMVPIAELPQSLFHGCNHAEIVRGDSMHPVIRNGALVVGKTFDKSRIISGDIYLIHTINDLHTVKYVHEMPDAGRVKLLSYNNNIPPQEISIDEIKLICRVLFIINPA